MDSDHTLAGRHPLQEIWNAEDIPVPEMYNSFLSKQNTARTHVWANPKTFEPCKSLLQLADSNLIP